MNRRLMTVFNSDRKEMIGLHAIAVGFTSNGRQARRNLGWQATGI